MPVFECISKDGLPRIFFHRMKESVKTVSLRWVVFVGSVDDTLVGEPGLYHWFEHIPFRGTRKFPGGYADTLAHFDSSAGFIGAHTSKEHTAFYAHVLKEDWVEALELITDLFSQPVLAKEGIEAEREIIYQEMAQTRSKPLRWIIEELYDTIWGSHPIGRSILGTEKTLSVMTADQLRLAHQMGYDQSRCALVIAGDLDCSDVTDQARRLVDLLPQNDLSPRLSAASFGELPEWDTRTIDEGTPFSVTTAIFLYEQPKFLGLSRERATWKILRALFSGASSPLFRVLREERNLVYMADSFDLNHADGGCLGLFAQMGGENLDAVVSSLEDVLRDDQLRSQEWFAHVKKRAVSKIKFRSICPHQYTEEAESDLVDCGMPISEEDEIKLLDSISFSEVQTVLHDLLSRESRKAIYREMS